MSRPSDVGDPKSRIQERRPAATSRPASALVSSPCGDTRSKWNAPAAGGPGRRDKAGATPLGSDADRRCPASLSQKVLIDTNHTQAVGTSGKTSSAHPSIPLFMNFPEYPII